MLFSPQRPKLAARFWRWSGSVSSPAISGKKALAIIQRCWLSLLFFRRSPILGLYAISTREISRPGSDEKKILGNVFAIRLAVFFLVLGRLSASGYFLSLFGAVKTGIIISALAYVFASSYSVLIGLFQKRLAMDKVAIGEFVGKIVQVAVIILVVRYNLGFLAIISSLFFNMLMSF